MLSHDSWEPIDRRLTDSTKWDSFDEDVLPMWIADMDFRCPHPIVSALQKRVEHGVFGYTLEPRDLRSLVVARLDRLYGWKVEPDALVFLPSVVVGFNLAAQALTTPGDGILLQPPVYFPILSVPKNARATSCLVPLAREADGNYEVDFDRIEASIDGRTRMLLQCNPHNPIGKAFSEDELSLLADICLRHDLSICSDEIHADFVYDDRRHVPIASLSTEVANRTITLMAPSKAFNIAGLHTAFAVIPNSELREKYILAKRGLVGSINTLGYVAMQAAYRDGDEWFAEVLGYVQENRDFVVERLRSGGIPGVAVGPIEATYLAWLDCRGASIPGDPYEFLLREAQVATVPGPIFGPEGEGFVRLNFACPRSTLAEGLNRIQEAIADAA
jgi:cystathionine beta-lyase